MALFLCPSCKEQGFTWSIDEEVYRGTKWGCYLCTYQALEPDERPERACQHCQTGEETWLEDEQRRYWWCYNCDRTTTIELIDPV